MELKPITPFEPISSNEIPDTGEWISQIKWDGVRVLTYHNGNELRFFNRKQKERTLHYPELTTIQTSAKSFILDGEVIALDQNGQPSFHEVMRRDGIRRMERVTQVMESVPVFYMIFDILYVNGKWVHTLPLKQRMELLLESIVPNQYVQVVSSQSDGHALFEVVKQHNMEGIVSKNVNSPYVIDGKNDNWRKIKNYKDVIAVIGGVTYRAGIVNSVLLGLYDEKDQLWYIGHAGTGKLTRKDWLDLTRLIEPLVTTENPFVNEVEKHTTWIQPVLTVKVQYIEWREGHSLRQPSIQAFVQVSPDTCRLNNHEE